MARVKPLGLAIVQEWLAAWDESNIFSDAAVRHLKSLITDPFCFVVVTLRVGRQPRSLAFRRVKHMLPPVLTRRPPPFWEAALRELREQIELFRSMPVGPVAPVAPSVGQLWHQTGVKSETTPRSMIRIGGVPKLERVLRWDGAEWVVAGLVVDDPEVGKQGKQVCDFLEALTYARHQTKWLDCEFIYTYDGSTRGNA
jgi:hypothetical protein